MKSLTLRCGAVVTVDDADFEAVSQFDWHVSHNGYAIRRVRTPGGPKRVVYMHLEIFGRPGCDVDHRDGRRLNNCRSNLRPATRGLNNANSRKRAGCSSRFKGVCWSKQHGRWVSYIRSNGKRKHIGLFDQEEDAARAYDEAALIHFGEFARTNAMEALYAA